MHLLTPGRLRGAAFLDGDAERGLAWSDMAILLRSVKRNGAPITGALDAAGIPYVVTGMTDLFQAKEAHAARQLFYFMAGGDGLDAKALARECLEADLGLETRALRRAVANAADSRTVVEKDTDEGARRRWGAYSLQRLFLTFLEDAGVREERVPNARGEVVFFNLGKFSQIITDYETIHYHSKPAEKYAAFANFLQYRAEEAYPEGWQDDQYANPDAVRIMTVHQAKRMEWPVVFLPALLRNRFPAPRVGGRTAWHLIPRDGVSGQPPLIWAWFAKRPRFQVHFTPTYGSWLNLVERWFAELTTKHLRRGVHRSVRGLEAAIREFIAAHNPGAKPFVWTKTADEILASIARFAQRTLSVKQAPRHMSRTIGTGLPTEPTPSSCSSPSATWTDMIADPDPAPGGRATRRLNGRDPTEELPLFSGSPTRPTRAAHPSCW